MKHNPEIGSHGEGFVSLSAHTSQNEHVAYVVVDKVGRLQVPKEYLKAMDIKDKVLMEFDGEKITIRSPQIQAKEE